MCFNDGAIFLIPTQEFIFDSHNSSVRQNDGCLVVEGLNILQDGEIKFDEKCKYDRLND